MYRPRLLLTCCLLSLLTLSPAAQARDVIAFWGFADVYRFADTANKFDFAGDVDNTASADANLQAFLGDATNFDANGGSGFTSYTSPTSGITYGPTRTLKWDDLKGGGNDFDIGGTIDFLVDKNDGNGPVSDQFGNDALLYITLNGLGYRDFQLRFDIEATPASLPSTFDIFYRLGGSGTWQREFLQDDIPLTFADYNPADPENQFADSGLHSLSELLNNQSQIELILSDFKENGNGEMEIDNLEITANPIPEPTTCALLFSVSLLAVATRSHRLR